ncbi:hypothetical protein HHL14_09915 [Paraburkholderia sp. G-4-1-8]|uniref:Uncharacterized protein n=1 Tax=Paraburkholderia antibiotica TaxID=2728839 RepID=A0A7X9ZY06_9BURK|nr:hypothetical protein [Paraburkholderia antibiotica]NML31150.1 hypothetical protein [Paraburkholderia antibiotica]
MVSHPPYSVVLTYSEENQALTVQSVDPAEVAPLVAGKIKMPILLDEHDFKIDDEFARRLGVAMLNVIALGQPDIRQYMSVTQDPVDRS